MLYMIRIKTLDDKILFFRDISQYKIKDGLIFFTNTVTNELKIFPVSSCEINIQNEA